MSGVHTHVWVQARHVGRCADPDCVAFMPLPLPVTPADELPLTQRPARARKPAKPRPSKRDRTGGIGNVIALDSRRSS